MRGKLLRSLILTTVLVAPLSGSRPLGASISQADAKIAADLAQATKKSRQMQQRWDRGAEPSEQEIREIESEFISLLNRAPENPEVGDRARVFYEYWWWRVWPPSSALLDAVERAPDPPGLALRLVLDRSDPLAVATVLAALEARPGEVALWARAAEAATEPAWKIALAEEACRRFLASSGISRSGSREIAAALAGISLHAQMDVGLAERAVATFKSLPRPVRNRLAAGAPALVRTRIGELPFLGEIRDLRLDLAAAFLAAGDPEKARKLVGRIPEEAGKPSSIWWSVPGTDGEEARDGARLFRRLLARTFTPSPSDPFELLVQAIQTDGSFGTPWNLVRRLAVARLAEQESYPAVAAYVHERARWSLEDQNEPAPERGVSPRLLAAVQGLEMELAKLRESIEERAAHAREAARAGLGPDPAPELIPRLLRVPGRVRFPERPLPEGVAPIELTAEQEKDLREAAKAMGLPAGFSAVRTERGGQRVAAIGVSQSYDPVGELSSGAYWIALSGDGGTTWDRPLYTGLRLHLPYVVRQASALPLWDGDRLRVEVEIREFDTETIVFPPVAPGTRRTAKGLLLEVSITELRRDTDGDGLTDLAEERLLTDPESPDTDGDAIADAADPLPGVPWAREPSPPARALAALLGAISGVEGRALIVGLPKPGVLCCAVDRPALTSEQTDFYLGDRALFAGLDPGRRLVVLSEEELKVAEEKFGPFFPKSILLFLFDRTGRRAYAVWSAGWQGGEVALEEKDGEWTAEEISSWIT